MVFHVSVLNSLLSLDTCTSCLCSVSNFMSHDCILTIEHWHRLLAESRPLGPFACCLLTDYKTVVLVVVMVLWL